MRRAAFSILTSITILLAIQTSAQSLCNTFNNIFDRYACQAGEAISPDWLAPMQVFPDGTSDELNGKLNPIIFRERFDEGMGQLHATRLFVSAEQFPPTAFKAYGVLAFTNVPDEEELERYTQICEAFIQTIKPATDDNPPPRVQMVTVWPVKSAEIANKLNILTGWHAIADNEDKCRSALESYDMSAATSATNAARASGFEANGIGPYLIAWSPTSVIGKADAVVLTADLSAVESLELAKNYMTRWKNDIENKPELFDAGFNVTKMTRYLRELADKHGVVFELFWNKG